MEDIREPDSKWWLQVVDDGIGTHWLCCACDDGRKRELRRALQHEQSAKHIGAVKYKEFQSEHGSSTTAPQHGASSSIDGASAPSLENSNQSSVLSLLLQRMTSNVNAFTESGETSSSTYDSDYWQPPIDSGINWDSLGKSGNKFSGSAEETGIARLARQLLDPVGDPGSDDSDDESDERSGEASSSSEYEEEEEARELRPQKRSRGTMTVPSREWFPWPDKVTCTLDIATHLGRSVFSQSQLEIFLWLLETNGVQGTPSVASMKSLTKRLQNTCGIETLRYKGAFGHTYFVNNIAQIIVQDFANPSIRPHFHFYPCDARGTNISGPWEVDRWLHEVDAQKLTPMARIQNQDYFIHEPARLRDGRVCMPTRWFLRDNRMYAKVWCLAPKVIREVLGWIVLAFVELEVREDEFLLSFPALVENYQHYQCPDPRVILGTIKEINGPLLEWTFTDPRVGNRWRVLSGGAPVYSIPLWLYCDDTSGNTSKKWNKHNSFLFTVASLAREHIQQEYNIHFLCTSNCAPPLEMLEGIVEQLDDCNLLGVWAYDPQIGACVLLILFILAILGDNPMQSEFAAHLGMRAKYFCRICWAKGHDANDLRDNATAPHVHDSDNVSRPASPTPAFTPGLAAHPNSPSLGGHASAQDSELSDAESNDGSANQPHQKRRNETGLQMLDRVRRFMTVHKLRSASETVEKLHEVFYEASAVGGLTRAASVKTDSGVKDTYLEYFLDKMAQSYSNKRTVVNKMAALEAFIHDLPENIYSPVWRLKELDPHIDTPIEVLHVILLGIVKYFWRDVCSNQVKSSLVPSQNTRGLLIRRLNSFDVKGLGIPPLAGNTLVQYAGSLTGRDFRAIAQAAPFVLVGIVQDECYRAWVALCRLMPFIWQPIIPNMNVFLDTLTNDIDYLLHLTALWTPRWFNKPKFHLLLHLPFHVRRFGPATLFATESFESFNAVIRAKSVHSNRHAPSRDIAHQFAQANRIRQLLSGAPVQLRSADMVIPPGINTIHTDRAGTWVNVGHGPLQVASQDRTISRYLGASYGGPKAVVGHCVPDGSQLCLFRDTLCGQAATAEIATTTSPTQMVQRNKSVILSNGDACTLEGWILFAVRSGADTLGRRGSVGQVHEIIRTKPAVDSNPRVHVLVRHFSVGAAIEPYCMPALIPVGWRILSLNDILCTVNVQHNCHANNCKTTGSRPVIEEREDSGRVEAIIEHIGRPDMMLNTAQMRDAIHVQPLRAITELLPPALRVTQIEQAVFNEVTRSRQRQAAQGNSNEGSHSRAQSLIQTAQANRGAGRGGRGRSRGNRQAGPSHLGR